MANPIDCRTGAGQHGVATATVAALFGFGVRSIYGQRGHSAAAPNVFRMRLLGAKLREVTTGTRTLKDAMSEALRDWITQVTTTFLCVGTVAAPSLSDVGFVTSNPDGREPGGKCANAKGDCLTICSPCGRRQQCHGLFAAFLADPECA